MFQAVQTVIGIEGLARKLTFLDALAIAVVAVGVLGKDFTGRGYRQARNVFVRVIGNILPHAVSMGYLLDGTIGIAGEFDN